MKMKIKHVEKMSQMERIEDKINKYKQKVIRFVKSIFFIDFPFEYNKLEENFDLFDLQINRVERRASSCEMCGHDITIHESNYRLRCKPEQILIIDDNCASFMNTLWMLVEELTIRKTELSEESSDKCIREYFKRVKKLYRQLKQIYRREQIAE